MMGPIGSMPGAQMAAGMGEVATRVTAIRERIEGLMPAGGFQLPGVIGAGGGTASGATAGSAATGVLGAGDAPLGPNLAAATVGAPGAAASTAAGAPMDAPGSTGVVRGAELAARLPERGRAWAPNIEAAALRAGIEPALLAAVVQHESNFDPSVVSRAGAIGLAQLMPGTAAGLGVDPRDPNENLDGGARYLRQQLDRFGSVDLALAAYNAGPNRVAQAGGVPRIQETMTYVDRVTTTWEQLR